MAGSINKVILVGNLGRDPEVRQSGSGQKIVSFSVATSDVWKGKNGERQERTEWHRVVIFNQVLADVVERYVKKGSKVYIEGALQSRKWTDGSGVEKTVTEVVLGNYRGELVLLDSRNGASASSFDDSAPSYASSDASGWDAKPAASTAGGAFDDEIPF